MGQVAWQKDMAAVAESLESSGLDAARRRRCIREILSRFGAWARTDNGPKRYASPSGRLVMRTVDDGSVSPLGEADAERVEAAMIALHERNPGQCYMTAAYGIGGFDLETIAGYWGRPQSKIRELVNGGLDYLDGIISGIE